MKLSTVLLAIALAACGADASHPTDAAIDSAPDAPIDAGGEPVTVAVSSGGLPVAGVAVYFQNADGTLVARVVTDAMGEAAQQMAPGGSVTALDAYRGQGTTHDLHTWMSVKQGDHLVLAQAGTRSETVAFTAPKAATASVYEFHATGADPNYEGNFTSVPPSATNPTSSQPVFDGATATDVLIIADLQSSTSQYIYAPGKPLTGSGSSVTVTGVYSTVEPATWTWTNVPADVPDLISQEYLTTSHGPIYEVSFDANVTNRASTKTLTRPALPGTKSILTVDVSSPTNHARSFLLDWAPRAATMSYDATDRRLRDLTTAMTFDPASHSFLWSEGATGADANVSVASLSAARGDLHWTWEVVAPHTATGLLMPVLPTGISPYNVLAGDTVAVARGMWVGFVGGYDVLRPLMLQGSILGLGTTAQGNAAYQTFAPP
jgi:hypothetical protein